MDKSLRPRTGIMISSYGVKVCHDAPRFPHEPTARTSRGVIKPRKSPESITALVKSTPAFVSDNQELSVRRFFQGRGQIPSIPMSTSMVQPSPQSATITITWSRS